MLYDRRDFGLLRLAGAYQWLPLAPLRALSPLKQLFHEAELLASLGLLAFSRSGEYLTLTPEGYRLLSSFDLHYQPPSKRPYSQSPALRRRLEVGAILLTCLGAGIEPALDKVERLKRQPVFLPAFALRAGDGNLMNAAGCAGFGHWGGAAYMVQYVCEEHSGFFMNNLDYLCKALKNRHFRGYGQPNLLPIYYFWGKSLDMRSTARASRPDGAAYR